MIQPEKLFSTPLWHIKAEDGDKKSIDELYEWVLDYQDDEGVTKSNRGGWQSSDSDNFDAIPHIDLLKKKLYHLGCGLKLQNWWVNVNKKGDWNLIHTHPNCDLSLVWYLTDGDICFDNPNSHNRLEVGDCSIWESKNKKGDVVVFPADLKHFVNPNQKDEDRMSLAFNINLL